jgi:hypothetical protein
MNEAKVGDLVEYLDQSSMKNRNGNYDYYPTGILGIVIGKDYVGMTIVNWFYYRPDNVHCDSYTCYRLKIISEAGDDR